MAQLKENIGLPFPKCNLLKNFQSFDLVWSERS